MNTSRLRAAIQVCCVIFSVLVPHPAHSQATPAPTNIEASGEPADYRAVVDLGLAEYRLGNFAEARSQFERAHKLFPNARSFRALGMVEFELRNYGDAIAYLESALASPLKPLDGKLRDGALKLLSQARSYVARLNLELEPDAASVVVDGVPVKVGPTGSLVLEVSDHVLEFRAPGRIAQKHPVKITGGEERSLRVVLHQNASDSSEKPRWYRRPWLWTAVGVVLVGAAVGTGLALREPETETISPQGGTTGISLEGPR